MESHVLPNLLFTKRSIDKKIISRYLDAYATYDFVDVIRIKQDQVQAFPLHDYSLIFTSVNGVEAFFANGFKPNECFTERNYNRIYCVGQKTKNALRRFGFGTYKTVRNAQELREFITVESASERFIHFCGNISLDVLSAGHPLQNIHYKKVVVYHTELLYPNFTVDFDGVVFFSPSGVRSFLKNNSVSLKRVYAIGETTYNELLTFGITYGVWSRESSTEDLLRVIAKDLEANPIK